MAKWATPSRRAKGVVKSRAPSRRAAAHGPRSLTLLCHAHARQVDEKLCAQLVARCLWFLLFGEPGLLDGEDLDTVAAWNTVPKVARRKEEVDLTGGQPPFVFTPTTAIRFSFSRAFSTAFSSA